MHRWSRRRLLCLVLLAGSAASAAGDERASERERVDLAAMQRIRAEALTRGQVAEHLFWLTDANGPRLTASPGWRRAAEWAVRTLRGWGASNARLEPWGTFGKSWSSSRATVELVTPVSAALRGYPLAWCGATPGLVTAEPVLAPLGTETEFDDVRDASKLRRHIRDFEAAWRGKLKGKLVLLDPPRELEPPLKEAAAHRYDATKLAELVAEIDPSPPPHWEWPLESIPAEKAKRAAFFRAIPAEVAADYHARLARVRLELWDFLVKEGVAGVLLTDRRGDGGLVFAESTGAYFPDAVTPPPAMVLTPESYNRVVRLLEHGLSPRLTLDVQVKVDRSDAPGHTVVAEIPGGKKTDETVMLGGHLDSWHTGTGATDDGAGCAVALEAFRILKTLKLPMARTVRITLWDGEEQGLFGSRGYVKQHFGDPVTMQLKPEHRSLAAYFNVDNGAGRIRGVYLQGNGMVRPIFESWMAPLRDLGVTTLTNRDTGGTDHLSFDAVGLPGFQFIQDPLDYNTRTHHSELDTFDHAPAGDLMQAAAVLASFVYDAATRPEMLPRKPVPAPLPARHEPPLSAPR
jgi:hypothetical protein